ncbi:hypothetical protein BH23ACT10_BH23ACT10_25860 [soil metagenome]
MSAPPAGYSGTPLARKLGVKPDTPLALVHAPDDIDALPDGVRIRRTARGLVEVAVAFFVSARRLDREIAWLRHLIGAGLVDNKVAAIDATWSGLRFVVRLEDR